MDRLLPRWGRSRLRFLVVLQKLSAAPRRPSGEGLWIRAIELERGEHGEMGHSNVWNSHPKNYGPGSRCW